MPENGHRVIDALFKMEKQQNTMPCLPPCWKLRYRINRYNILVATVATIWTSNALRVLIAFGVLVTQIISAVRRRERRTHEVQELQTPL